MKTYIEPKAEVINLSSEGPLLDMSVKKEPGGGEGSNQRDPSASSNQGLNIWDDM